MEGMREVGVLLIAFAPLDAVLAAPAARPVLLLFLLLGITFFSMAVLLERRGAHGPRRRRR